MSRELKEIGPQADEGACEVRLDCLLLAKIQLWLAQTWNDAYSVEMVLCGGLLYIKCSDF